VVREVLLEVSGPKLSDVLKEALIRGIRKALVAAGEAVTIAKGLGVETYSPDEAADVLLVDGVEALAGAVQKGRRVAFQITVRTPEDVRAIEEAAALGAEAIIVATGDWRIIPLENLVAALKGRGVKLYARASRADEIPTLFGVLELGVDGVTVEVSGPEEVARLISFLEAPRQVELKVGEVTEVREVAMGERACVDTASILEIGEGLLIGSQAGFLFLIHNESIGSSFTSPRPFRVNAGAIHNYVLMPDGKTRYLSELAAGDEALIVGPDGRSRVAVVGRVKIERRPLILVRAKADGSEGSILVQNAETIRFVREDGQPIAVTELKRGDRVLVYVSEARGRHFGMAVEEFVIEK
jgi:3-dehydroquinate synthase II